MTKHFRYAYCGMVIVLLPLFLSCKEDAPPPEHLIAYTIEDRRNFGDLEFSPDGSTLAAITHMYRTREFSSIVFLDVITNVNTKIFGGFEREEGLVSIAFSPDGGRLLSGGGQVGTLRVWSVADGTEELSFPDYDDFVRLAYSPNGEFLATADSDGNIILRNADTLKVLWQSKYRSGVSSLAFTPDSQILLSGGRSREVIPWNVATGEAGEGYKNVHDPVSGILFTHNGESFLTYDGGYENTVKLWEFPSGNLLHTFEFGENTIYGVALHPYDLVAVAVGHKRHIALLDLAGGEVIKTIDFRAYYDNFDVCFSPDGQTFAVSSDRGVSIFSYDLTRK